MKASDEIKTKPTQHSVKELRSIGIQPDIIICRSERPIPLDHRKKISLFCNVDIINVIETVDVKTIYEAPISFFNQKLDIQVLNYFKLKSKKIWELNDFQGKWLVLYFYPKDFTAGCTIEAKGFSELKNDFSKYNAEIVGISADNQDSHESFCSEKSINYTLLSDPEGIISDKYGSWIPPFSDRNTFLISPEGEISYRWISVLPINHAKEVLNVLKKKI